jgi:hypothetical protein
MLRKHHLSLALAVLVAITSVVAAPLAPAAAQNPNKPVTEYVDDTFPAPNLTAQCGFKVTARVTGTFTFHVKPDGTELAHIRFQHTFTGPGGSVTVNRTENVKFTLTILEDGTEVEDLVISGTLMYHMVLPGHGSIANNSGREILQLTWQWDEDLEDWNLIDEQVFFDAGPNDALSADEFAIICALLA